MKKINRLKSEDETLDSFFKGRILVLQKKRGFRFSIDAPLLADSIQTKKSDELLELGAGNGIVSLLLTYKPFKHILALEIQESLANLARRNVALNCLEDKITIVQEDLRTFQRDKKFDVIFSNPPYIKKMGGHLSYSLEKSIAKHELKCNISDIMQKTNELLKNRGRAYFIYPTKRKEDFEQAAAMNKLKIKSLRFIHPRKNAPANFFLAECDFSSSEIVYLEPFYLYDEKGNYTPEIEQIFSGRVGVSTYQKS